jgi:thioredoxin 1
MTMSSTHTVELTAANFEEKVLKASGPVLVDFWAEWCQPCKMLGPRIDELAGEYAGRATVGKVNVDTAGELAEKYNIQAIPTVIFFKDGKPQKAISGYQPKKNYAEVLDQLA